MDDNTQSRKFSQDESGSWNEVEPDSEPSESSKAINAKGQVELDSILVLLESDSKSLKVGCYVEDADVFVYAKLNNAQVDRLITLLQVANDTAMELHFHNLNE